MYGIITCRSLAAVMPFVRCLDIVHLPPHLRVRGDEFLESGPTLIIIFMLWIAHRRSPVGVRGRIKQVVDVEAAALAGKVRVVGRGAVRHGS